MSQAADGTPRVHHHGRAGELFVIFVVNILLTVVTAGVYHFWAKTRVRRYLWSQTAFDGERFEYTGRGLELFLGYLMVMALLAVLALVYGLIVALLPAVEPFFMLALYVLVFVLTGVGIYSAQRYLLSRTRLRGIRFARTGSALAYAGRMIGHGLLTVLTLGLYAPFMRNALVKYAFNNTWYGNERFAYNGRGRELFPEYLLTAFLTPFTLGLIWFWYRTLEYRYIASRLSLKNVNFAFAFTMPQLAWLSISNFFVLLLTLGLAYPWVLVRRMRFFTRHLGPSGRPDYAAIAQSEERAPRVGEGLAEAFDLGAV
ncbi:MAG: DUF898 domain-containing protein [Gammaproteobacteria bacterium]|nr:DUF898 domain-containing protein [Gammaproteobacteria bacterium]